MYIDYNNGSEYVLIKVTKLLTFSETATVSDVDTVMSMCVVSNSEHNDIVMAVYTAIKTVAVISVLLLVQRLHLVYD